MLETIVSLVALAIACLALYRATRRQLPSVYFLASNEDFFEPSYCITYSLSTRVPALSPAVPPLTSHHDQVFGRTEDRPTLPRAPKCPVLGENMLR